MPEIPGEILPDSTIPFLLDPYWFISKTCRRHGTDLFQTRLLFEKTICMTGSQAAELFYDPSRFQRSGAAPEPAQKTLFGQGGVQGLDDEAHRQRKQMFMSLMTPQNVRRLTYLTLELWRGYARKWQSMDRVVLYDESRELLSRAVCEWAGIPLAQEEVARRTAELSAMFEWAGAVGIKHLASRRARQSAEGWAEALIQRIRVGALAPPEESAGRVIAMHCELNAELLPPRIAAVEILNVLRPTVAVSVFITFAALALHSHRRCRERIEEGEDGYTEAFVQEVRRFYPFFPAVAAKVRGDFTWKGYFFPKGRKAVLDLHGTDHDARSWEAPLKFRPERFLKGNVTPFNLIPQGGGDYNIHHRCPGEGTTIELMKAASIFLAKEIEYDVPEQDLRADSSRLPALPRSRFLLRNVGIRRAAG